MGFTTDAVRMAMFLYTILRQVFLAVVFLDLHDETSFLVLIIATVRYLGEVQSVPSIWRR